MRQASLNTLLPMQHIRMKHFILLASTGGEKTVTDLLTDMCSLVLSPFGLEYFNPLSRISHFSGVHASQMQ